MGGRASKQKGYRTENNLVHYLNDRGLSAKRQPLSGALKDFPHDIAVVNPNCILEVKARKTGSGFKTLHKWIGRADALILKEDREDCLVAVKIDYFIQLLLSHKDYKPPVIEPEQKLPPEQS